MSDYSVDVRIDCTGTFCPVPVNRTAARVRKMRPGQVLQVVGDDPGLQIDIPAWCMSNGHQFLGLERQAGLLICTLRVSGRS